MEATGSSMRYRANVGRNSKGWTLDFTVERTFSEEEMMSGDNEQREDELIASLKSFGAKLEAAYPATFLPEKVAANGKE